MHFLAHAPQPVRPSLCLSRLRSPCRESYAQGAPQGPPPSPGPRRGHASAAATPAAQGAPFPVRPPRPRPPPAVAAALAHRPTKFSSTELLPALWPPTTAICGRSRWQLWPMELKASCSLLTRGISSSIPRLPMAPAALARAPRAPLPPQLSTTRPRGVRGRCSPPAWASARCPLPVRPHGRHFIRFSGDSRPERPPVWPRGCARSPHATPDWPTAPSLVHTSQ